MTAEDAPYVAAHAANIAQTNPALADRYLARTRAPHAFDRPSPDSSTGYGPDECLLCGQSLAEPRHATAANIEPPDDVADWE